MGWFWPSPQTRPALANSFQRSTQYLSGTPKFASFPVIGLTKPILIARPASAAALTLVVVSAAAVVVVALAAVVAVAAAAVVRGRSIAAGRRQETAEAAYSAYSDPCDPCLFQKVMPADRILEHRVSPSRRRCARPRVKGGVKQ
jgi:hypothetical protein